MKLTKYEHACFTLQKDGKLLVIDPGAFTTDLTSLENVVAIVVTHEHADHFDPDKLAEIYDKSPESILISYQGIVNKMVDHKSQVVNPGDKITVGPFKLEFFGGEHAIIHPSFPTITNLGVMIDDAVYYPGDSFTKPEKPVKVLALPVTAPWLKISEVMDFLLGVRPELAFPTHDAIASEFGKSLPDRMLPDFAKSYGGTYQRINNPIEI